MPTRRTISAVLRAMSVEQSKELRKENTMFASTWVKDAAERAVKTFCQSLLSVLTLDGANVLSLDWAQTLSVSGTAALVSVLTSVVSTGLGDKGTASAVELNQPAV